MDDDLCLKLKELSTSMQTRAAELALPGGNTDISALMSGIALTLEALLVIAEESKTPRSGPSVEPVTSLS
jgi:translation initiation factor 2 gamma subunit (eIF-2gamma)